MLLCCGGLFSKRYDFYFVTNYSWLYNIKKIVVIVNISILSFEWKYTTKNGSKKYMVCMLLMYSSCVDPELMDRLFKFSQKPLF